MEVRRAVQEDIPHVIEFTRNTYAWGDYVPRVIADWVSAGTAYVAIEGDAVLGVVNMELLPTGVAWLEGIRVRPDSRRRGVGTILTRHVLDIARRSGASYAMLMVADWNEPSHGLVRKLGFRPVMTLHWGSVTPTGAKAVKGPRRRELAERALKETGGYFCIARKWICTRATPEYVLSQVKEVYEGPGIGLDEFSVGNPTYPDMGDVLATKREGFSSYRNSWIVYELRL